MRVKKHMAASFLAIIILATMPGVSYPIELYFTFDGTITSFTNNTNSPYALAPGDAVRFVYMADTDNRAWKITNTGVITYWERQTGPYETFFETNRISQPYISGTYFPPYYENYIWGVWVTETHYGHAFDYPTRTDEVRFASGNDSISNAISIQGVASIFDLSIGISGRFTEYGAFRINDQQIMDIIDGTVVLTSISTTNPTAAVPEPVSFHLLLLGFAGIILLRALPLRRRSAC